MKKITALLLALTLLASLAACGETEAKSIDLNAFWEDVEAQYGAPNMAEASDELVEGFYPGLTELEPVQSVVKIPVMSAVVSEYVFLECASPEDAAKAGEILQKRADDQAAGGAWYPESVENWGKAKVFVIDNYAALIAAGDQTGPISEAFQALFE